MGLCGGAVYGGMVWYNFYHASEKPQVFVAKIQLAMLIITA